MNTLPSRTTKSVLKATAQRIQAIALNAFWHLVRLMPPAASAATGSAIFRFVGPRTRKQAFIRRNLARVFPRHEPRQIEAVAREVWGNFGAVLAEYPHLHYYCSDASAPDFDIHVAPETAAIVASRQPAVYVAAHLANWELATAAITRLGIPFSAVYAPQGNPSSTVCCRSGDTRSAAGSSARTMRSAVSSVSWEPADRWDCCPTSVRTPVNYCHSSAAPR